MSLAELDVPPVPTIAEEPVLAVRDLNHWFGKGETKSQVLFKNTLDVQRGEIVIMLGPSGSGKTTLLTLIGGLRTVQEGSLKVLGQELRGLAAGQLVQMRRRIGFIFQAHNLFSSLTATQNVQLALELKDLNARARHARATEVLRSLGLAERLDYRPDHLSGGLKQRVAIARALANRPELILADEPTAALDAGSAGIVVEELTKLAKRRPPEEHAGRSTIVVVTHDEKILCMADRIVTMRHGAIVSNVLRVESDTIIRFLKNAQRPGGIRFAEMTDETLRRIASRMGREEFPKGATIFKQGDEGDRFYVLWQGKVAILIDQPGKEPFRRPLEPGDVFGEKALQNPNLRRTGSAIALEDVELYSMDKRAFDATLAESASFNQDLQKLWT